MLAGALAAILGMLALTAIVATVLGSGTALPGSTAYAVSGAGQRDIPPLYLALYQDAAVRYGLDWSILAGVGRVECDHGRDPDPSCTRRGSVNTAGAGGPAQFLAATWSQYGVDGNGDGVADRWDPRDAIYAMANYLRASGAPGDWRGALFAYNHSSSYVDSVLAWARRYRGQLLSAGGSPAQSAGVARRISFNGPWLASLPGTALRCDARIVPDVVYLMRAFRLTATACFAAHGHAGGGEHPLGLALDAVPADGDWSHTLALARAFGWQPACARTGCAGSLRAPIRFIGYNGYPGHGDPAHAGANAHIHLSWSHAPAAPLSAAAWVDVF